MNEHLNAPIDADAVMKRLRRAVENLESAATYVEEAGADRAPVGRDLARAEAANDLRELHDIVSRRLDSAIARLRTAVREHGDA